MEQPIKIKIKGSCGHEYMTTVIYPVDLGFEDWKRLEENEPCPHCLAILYNRKPSKRQEETKE